MIRKLRIRNFKSLRDTGNLEIRPLTFLVGPNSAGKTALIQSLLMLRQTVESTDREAALVTSDGFVRLGSYPEFVFKRDRNQDVQIDVTFDEPDFRAPPDVRAPNDVSLAARFFYDERTTEISVRSSVLKSGDYRLRLAHVKQTRGRYEATFTYRRRRARRRVLRQKFYSYYLFNPLRDAPTFYRLTFRVEEAFKRIFYLGPMRTSPERIYITSGQAPVDVGTKGERSVDVLWFCHRSSQIYYRNIERDVQKWLTEFGFASEVRLDPVGTANYYQLILTDPATGVDTALPDVGFGISQVLPVIIAAFYAPHRSDLLIEQPEVHLHPAAQAVLGDLLVDASTRRGHARTMIIETHSEHLLARVRRRIAEGRIPHSHVAIYYFEPSADGTDVQEIVLSSEGQYIEFPEGFFEEDVEEAFAHLRAIAHPPEK